MLTPAQRRRYDRDRYKGHRQSADVEDKKVLISIRLPQSVVGHVTRIVLEGLAHQNGQYRNTNQAYGAFIVKGIQAHNSEAADEAKQAIAQTEVVESVGKHRKQAQATYSRFKTELRELETIGATDAACHYYHAARNEVEKMDAQIWRNWWLKTAAADFPKLHNARPKPLSLDDVDELTEHPRPARKQHHQLRAIK